MPCTRPTAADLTAVGTLPAMRAWRVHELGEPEAVLRLDDVDAPVAGPGEVVVDVAAASLNFPDVLMCRGEYQVKPPLPFTPGAEVSGVVAALGDGADAGRCSAGG